jgi:tetratricopeptide (TPR) repeat protein
MKKRLFFCGLILSFLFVLCSPLAAESTPALGDDLFAEGLYEEAIAAYELELETVADPAPIYNNLAAAYFQVGNVEQAISYFQLAADAAPDNGMPRINLAMLYELTGDLDAAKEKYLEAATSTDSVVAVSGYLGAAMLLFEKEDLFGAVSTLETALARIETETAPEFQDVRSQIYDNIGYIFTSAGQNEAAFDAFAAATQTGTENPVPWLILGAFLEEAGMYEQALLIYQEAITRDINNSTPAQEAYDSLHAKVEEESS